MGKLGFQCIGLAPRRLQRVVDMRPDRRFGAPPFFRFPLGLDHRVAQTGDLLADALQFLLAQLRYGKFRGQLGYLGAQALRHSFRRLTLLDKLGVRRHLPFELARYDRLAPELCVHFGDRRLVFRAALEERPKRLVHGAANLDNAQTVAVREYETTVAALQVAPELPDPELPLAHIDVVEQHDAAIREFRQPGFEVMGDIVVSVPPIDMQQIDRTVAEMRQCLIERRSDQSGKPGILTLVNVVERREDLFTVEARVRVPLPRIDGIALRHRSQALHRLTKDQTGKAIMRAEFDESARPQRLGDPEGKGCVLVPGRREEVLRLPERGWRYAIPQRRNVNRRCAARRNSSGVLSSGLQLLKAQKLRGDAL